MSTIRTVPKLRSAARRYFGGGGRRFRIRYDKLVAIDPYQDGVRVRRDAQTAKPQIFVTGDGWFTFNLLTNVASL